MHASRRCSNAMRWSSCPGTNVTTDRSSIPLPVHQQLV
jgi:hypothetical protein